jgi:hypothetical protein
MDSRSERNVTEFFIQHPLQLIANARHADISSLRPASGSSAAPSVPSAQAIIFGSFFSWADVVQRHTMQHLLRPPAYFRHLCTPLLIQLLYLHMRTRGVV